MEALRHRPAVPDEVGRLLAREGRDVRLYRDPRDERDLLLRVETGLRVSQGADAVDERVGAVGLEREDPLPVAQAEGAGRVRQHLREATAELAVVAQELGALVRGQEVPLRCT